MLVLRSKLRGLWPFAAYKDQPIAVFKVSRTLASQAPKEMTWLKRLGT